jgi:hypothetical protein
VAVGVAVAVAVAVAVEVGVSAAVAVDVAVAVGVAVAVAVVVSVAVAVAVAVDVTAVVEVAVGVAVGSGVEETVSNSSTRLLSRSAMYRLSPESTADENGWHRPPAPTLQLSELKSPPCPKTRLAVELVSGVLNSSTLSPPSSAM